MTPRGKGASGRPTVAEVASRLDSLEAAVHALAAAVGRLGGEQGTTPAEPEVTAARRELLDRHVPPDETVGVPATSSVALLELRRPLSSLGGQVDTISSIAALEAARVNGLRFLLLGDPAAPDEFDPALAAHVAERYEVLGSAPGAGTLIDMRAGPPEAGGGSLGDLVAGLPAAEQAAVLDWTDLDLAVALPANHVFTPLDADDDSLPYLSATIDLVAVDEPARLPEAERVAAEAAILVAPDENGGLVITEVRSVRSKEPQTTAASVLLVVVGKARERWAKRLAEELADKPQVTVKAAADPLDAAAEAQAEVVIVAESGVLPLQGCIEACARTLASSDGIGGVAVKLVAADGGLEAAGTVVFADGSAEPVAPGRSASAPWHEYVRPVCAATGLVALRGAAVSDVAGLAGPVPRGPLDTSGRLWAAGWRLLYQPEACAVRAIAGDAPREPGSDVWLEALGPRPDRPDELHEADWHRLVALEEIGAP